MLRSLLATLLIATALPTLVPRIAHADDACGQADLSDDALAALQHAASVENDDKTDDASVYNVPVYLHVVRTRSGGDGDMPVAHAKAIVIDVLNQAFAAQHIPFTFELAKIDYLDGDDATYHLAQGSQEEASLYDAMAVSGRRSLNIFIVGARTDTRVTGWAQFLFDTATNRGDHVVLRYYPNTGGFSDPLVPVHETGHWLGLLHTFQFGCGQVLHGDLIYDTPTQMQTWSCAADTDTCPDDPGLDPVENIMGYSEGCRHEFSPGQIRRMTFLYRTVRGGKGDEQVTPDAMPAQTAGCAATDGGGGAGAVLLALGLAVAARNRRRRC